MYQEAILKQTKIILIETKIATNFATVLYFNFDETTTCLIWVMHHQELKANSAYIKTKFMLHNCLFI